MKMRKWLLLLVMATLPGVVGAVPAGLVIRDAWTYAPPPGGRNAAVFATIVNTSSTDDRLLSATTPAAEITELHTMIMNDDGVMRMRHAKTLTVPAQSVLQFAPGGNHVMLMGLVPRVYGKPGDSFPLRLTFRQAGEQTVMVKVRSRGVQPGKK